MSTRHVRLRINTIHGDFLGSIGPILINLWKKTLTGVDQIRLFLQDNANKLPKLFRMKIASEGISHRLPYD